STVPLQPTNDWKNQIHFPGEEVFLSTGYGGNERWVKFVIPTNDPPRVFYGGRNYDFHYEFATARLELFRGVSPTDFERQTLFETSRRAWLGSGLYPRYNTAEYGIQFVAQDVLPPERVRDLLELVRSTVIASPSVTAFYIPTFEQ